MDSSMTFLDGNYNVFMESATSSFNFDAELFDFNQVDGYVTGIPFDFSLPSVADNALFNDSPTCNPADIMAPPPALNGFSGLLNDGWVDNPFAPTDGSELLTVPGAPSLAPLATPPSSSPNTPKKAHATAPPGGFHAGLPTPPPTDRPLRRTRRYNGYDEICRLSQLNLDATKNIGSSVNPTAIFGACNPVTPDLRSSPDVTPSLASASSSLPSSSLPSPASTPRRLTPVPKRSTGAQRVTLAIRTARTGNYGQPFPTNNPDRPFGCRHPGHSADELPCKLDFARKHDWSRHQRVHTGETPYCCRGCDRFFKRPDARGRHWDSKSECEVIHTSIVRELLQTGKMMTDDRDVPVLRRRAQKNECRRESKRTGIPVKELKARMRNIRRECDDGLGF